VRSMIWPRRGLAASGEAFATRTPAGARALPARSLTRRALTWPGRGPRCTIGLASGAVICVRLIRPADKPALVDAFGRLSDDSRYLRFFGPTPSLNDRVLTYLTEVDHRHHSALVALEPHDARVIAVARYVRRADLAGSADIAVTVVDEWQGRGVGRALLSLLVERATQAGFQRLTASVLATNRPMLGLLCSHGFVTTCVDNRVGVVDLELGLGAMRTQVTACATPAVRPC
jgi:GNAT superfamily N-acetyltransferase